MAGIMSATEQYSMIEGSWHLSISDHLGQEQVTPLASIPTAASAAPKLGPQPTTSQETTGEPPPPGTKEDQ